MLGPDVEVRTGRDRGREPRNLRVARDSYTDRTPSATRESYKYERTMVETSVSRLERRLPNAQPQRLSPRPRRRLRAPQALAGPSRGPGAPRLASVARPRVHTRLREAGGPSGTLRCLSPLFPDGTERTDLRLPWCDLRETRP